MLHFFAQLHVLLTNVGALGIVASAPLSHKRRCQQGGVLVIVHRPPFPLRMTELTSILGAGTQSRNEISCVEHGLIQESPS